MNLLAQIDRLPRKELVALLGHIAQRLALEEPTGEPDDEFLSVKQLALRTPLAEGTIRNLVSAGTFIEGLHYSKRGNRVIFSWKAVRAWLMNPPKKEEPAPHVEPHIPSRRRSA